MKIQRRSTSNIQSESFSEDHDPTTTRYTTAEVSGVFPDMVTDTTNSNHHSSSSSQEQQENLKMGGSSSYKKQRPNVFVFVLVVLFGLSSWIVVNGLYTCLPLFMLKLPESYAIAADMNFALQLANVFPFFLFILACLTPWRRVRFHIDSFIIILLLVVGFVACVLLAFLWDKISVFNGQKRSVAFLVLVFIVGAVDCTSSVVYWPFISHYTSYYTTALSIGEGSTALVAGIIGLIMQPGKKPLFPFSVFALLMSLLVALSGIAFLLVRFLPYCKREMIEHNPLSPSEGDVLVSHDHSAQQEQAESPVPKMEPIVYSTWRKVGFSLRLIAVQGVMSFVQNGILVSIGPYIFNAYPHSVDLLRYSILLTQIFDPFCCLLAYFCEPIFKWYVAWPIHFLWMALSIFQFIVALLNPRSPRSGSLGMGIGLVIISIVTRVLMAFGKTSEWLLMHNEVSKWTSHEKQKVSENKKKIYERIEVSPFRIAGLAIQMGALLGSVIIIILTQRHVLKG